MAIDGINNGINYIYLPQDYNNTDRKRPLPYDNGECKQLVGSAQTQVVKKGFKYFWKEFKGFMTKLFKGDKDARQQAEEIYNIYDNANKTINVINDLSDIYNDNGNNYDYKA